MKNNIIFFGELPENIIHGISISNEINIDILSEYFNVIKIHEVTNMNEHSKFTFSKSYNFLKYLFKLLRLKLKYKNIEYLYASLSISRGGIIKNIIFSLAFKILNFRSKIILHNYRGDLEVFYKKNRINAILCNLLFSIIHRLIFLSKSLIPIIAIKKKNKFCVVPNCVRNIQNFQNLNLRKDGFLYISHYIKSKGVFDLLDALKYLDRNKVNYKINLYGQFTNENDFNKIVSHNSEKIKINNFLDDDVKLSVINKASCLILPSHNEGQPQIILEAMSIGTPVIATNVGDIPTMLGIDYPFLIPANSPDKLANAIKNFLKLDQIELNKLSIFLKNRYNNYYSYEIHKTLLLKTFF